jgi:tripartite ATP-independent transporter DctP family solute receptor
MKKTLVYLLLLVMAISVSTEAFAAKVKFGHIAPTFHGMSAGAEAFADYVREKTNGKIDISTFPMGQLGNERSMAAQVQSGSLQIAAITTAVLQNFVPETAILDMPFIFPNRETAYAVLDDDEVKEKIFSYLPAKGFVGIGWTENEIRDFTNTKHPVHTPEDIKGLKVRVMNSPAYLDTFNQLGASTVGIPFPEVYSALQTGVIDAQENPLMTAVLMKFPEVTKYVTNTQHALTECIIIVNAKFWKRIGPENQQILRDAAKIATEVNRTRNQEIKKSLPKLGISIEEYCEQTGAELVNLTAQEREQFRVAMVPVWDKYRGIIGDEIFDFMLTKIEEHKQ